MTKATSKIDFDPKLTRRRIRRNIWTVISVFISAIFCLSCEKTDSSRAEYSYSDDRVKDELRRLEQNAQIEDVLGHDTAALKKLLAKQKNTGPEKARTLLVQCRDEYLKGLRNKSGVPLGGMGAGTVELWPDGALHDWRIAGNWDRAQEAEFSCFAIRTQASGRAQTRVLQDASWAGRQRTKEIKYEGRFPFVFLDYGSGNQPVSVKARVFSPFIPHDAENSCLPAACFTFEVTNNSNAAVDASALFAVGIAPFIQRGTADFTEDGDISTLNYKSGRDAISLSTSTPDCSFSAGWAGNFLPPGFADSGALSGKQPQENGRIALCSQFTLSPQETREIPFLLSWYFPDQRQRPTASYEMEAKFKELGTTQKAEANKLIGRRYNKFGSLKTINEYFFQNKDRLEGETLLWVNSIYESSLDPSLKSLLCNSLYPLFKTSFWTEDGLFNILESTNCCANPDCIHVRYYGSIPLALLFPELDQQILRRMAKYRGPFGGAEAGQIPEQFYGFSLELPFGRPLLQNNLSFVLMVYRDYLWTGDREFLEELWPAARDAMELLIRKDTDGDALPDGVGILQSYDDYDMGDSPTYISVIWLASLRAAEEMAGIMGDRNQAKRYHDLFTRGQETVENTLWNGEYYMLAEGDNARVCFADALNGQWYADMLGLGDLLDAQRIQKTLTAIFAYNHPATPYGIVNGCVPGKGIDYPKQGGYFQTQTASVWPGATFAVESLGLYRGFLNEPLQAVKEVHDNYATRLGNLWNIRESLDAESGLPMAWPYYYRPMSAWSVLLGLQGFNYNAAQGRLVIKPPAQLDSLRAPLVLPGSIGTIDFSRTNGEMKISVSVEAGSLNLREIHLPELSADKVSCNIASAKVLRKGHIKETVVLLPSAAKLLSNQSLNVELRAQQTEP